MRRLLTPLHVQLSDLMRVKILSEDWKAGTYIPSEAGNLWCQPRTIRKAYSIPTKSLLLTQKGHEQRRSFLTPFVMRQEIPRLPFAAALAVGGFEYETESPFKFKQVVPADQVAAEHLETSTGSDVLFWKVVSER